MGPWAFFAGLLLSVMGMGKWQETGSPFWLAGSLTLFVVVLISGLASLGGGKKG
ncbi:hypothetical protein [Kitasatospora sp. NPDC057223]|uniref:hypothetical protein n=1 Tax=Kitasatospora sp. NPDC057223 TaxID=3346055 RepID=UPI00363741C8